MIIIEYYYHDPWIDVYKLHYYLKNTYLHNQINVIWRFLQYTRKIQISIGARKICLAV